MKLLKLMIIASCLLLWLAIPFTSKASGSEYNVRQFGAKGNDSMDDLEAIQKALNMARETNEHITVIIPPGTYYLDEKTLHIYSNTTLKADGATIVHRNSDALMLVNWPEDKDADLVGGYNRSTNITIKGGVWDGNADSSTPTNLFFFVHASNINISDVTMKTAAAITLSNSQVLRTAPSPTAPSEIS